MSDLSVGAEQHIALPGGAAAGRSPARIAREPWLGPRARAAARKEKGREARAARQVRLSRQQQFRWGAGQFAGASAL